MRILIIGSGGREHAIGHALARSRHAPELFFAHGNAGTAELGTNTDVRPDDEAGILDLVEKQEIDLTIVGPEIPLVHGLVDLFEARDLAIVGPTAAAARLEGSKAFAKAFMERHSIPTARHRTFLRDQYEEARQYIEREGAPIVLKASGLAAGKGAIVCHALPEAFSTLDEIFRHDAFGDAGDELVVEEFMRGEEASIFVLTDGTTHQTLPPAQDHKPIGEGDTGPNTGGMGAYAPATLIDGAMHGRIDREIIAPTLNAMRAEGHTYRGILYVGLMITETGPRVVEYNCRFGDPETQIVLPLLKSDAVDVFLALAEGTLSSCDLVYTGNAAATVVLASGGYPDKYETGFPIDGLDAAQQLHDVSVYHAGTARDSAGRIITSGGRVLSVTALGDTLLAAVERAYEAADLISFEGKYLRRDIGWKGLARARTV